MNININKQKELGRYLEKLVDCIESMYKVKQRSQMLSFSECPK